MPKLLLVRGLPGSGKSTYASGLSDYVHVEADHYMRDSNNEYKFDPRKLKQCHEFCQANTRYYLERGYNVVVSNTFTQKWEMLPYFELARELGIQVEVITMNGNYGSIHNVPQSTIDKMRQRWED